MNPEPGNNQQWLSDVIVLNENDMPSPPVTEHQLDAKVSDSEKKLSPSARRFWNLIKIPPKRWHEDQFRAETDGFWAVAVLGHQVIWYNEIEEGFSTSGFEKYGHIGEYWCDQGALNSLVGGLMLYIQRELDSPSHERSSRAAMNC
ncbi:MAG: hypothetical protein AAFY56_06125 [Pseudomonadota bacterium]